ncbi:hypothetical protein FJY94_03450 [Candidatus Kaiserbacteria bacterium]|nr:hypothetical protein [Candidatus Kaiserbacteria bacterium]
MRGHLLRSAAAVAFLVAAGIVLVAWLRPVAARESFTELYLDDHVRLMEQVAQGAPLSFSFTIRNLEGATTSYRYRVFVESRMGVRQSIAEDLVTLADGESATIPQMYRIPRSFRDGELIIELPERMQWLHVSLAPPDR